jgi:hypothetical protein
MDPTSCSDGSTTTSMARNAFHCLIGGLATDETRRARNVVSYDGRMSAETVGMHMPAMVTLDDLAAMNAADANGHRYEASPEGVLSVMPLADSEHAQIASRLFAWLIMAGRPNRYSRSPASAFRDTDATGAASLT